VPPRSPPPPLRPQVPGMKEILLLGFYQPHEALGRFLVSAQQEFRIPIRSVGPLAPRGWQPPSRLPGAGREGSAEFPLPWALLQRCFSSTAPRPHCRDQQPRHCMAGLRLPSPCQPFPAPLPGGATSPLLP